MEYVLIIKEEKSVKIENSICIIDVYQRYKKIIDHSLPCWKRERWWNIFDIIYFHNRIIRVQYFFSKIKIYISHVTSYHDKGIEEKRMKREEWSNKKEVWNSGREGERKMDRKKRTSKNKLLYFFRHELTKSLSAGLKEVPSLLCLENTEEVEMKRCTIQLTYHKC